MTSKSCAEENGVHVLEKTELFLFLKLVPSTCTLQYVAIESPSRSPLEILAVLKCANLIFKLAKSEGT